MRTVDAAGLAIGGNAPPRIMGVVNVSPESPYDPSVFTDATTAADHIDRLIEEGADIVDVGLATANKRYRPLSADEELARLTLAGDAIASASGDAVFSIETRYHEVVEAAIDRGFEMVNDVCGFADPELPITCADHDVAVVKMASPPDLSRPGAIESVDEIHEAIKRGGFTNRTIIDPAFGGWSEEKTLEDDREIFRRLEEFRAYGRPILVSINRKNFLRELADRPTDEALPVSLAATSMAVERGADVVRTHDVAATRDAAIVGHELGRQSVHTTIGDIAVTELDVHSRSALRRQLAAAGVDTARGDDWAWRVFALDGLRDDWAIERLEEIGVAVYGTDPVVLAAPVRTFRRLHTLAADCPSPIDEVLIAITRAVR